MPQVSIIIPVYNTEAYLEECLLSVQNQTFADFEVIIVNDGSTDNSAAIIQKFVTTDNRFQSVLQENSGLSEARNTGIRLATAPWITFVDSDDMLAPNFLIRMLTLANGTVGCCSKKIIDIVCCGTKKFEEKIPALNDKTGKIKLWNPDDALAQALYQDRIPDHSAWNKLYASHLWKDDAFPPGKYFEDIATIPRIFQKATLIVSTDAPLYLYRIHKSSILRTNYTPKKAELLEIAENVYKGILAQENKKQKLIKAAQNLVFSASFSILMRTPDTEEFKNVRNKAWKNIVAFRWSNLFDTNSRRRNKIAAVLSIGGRQFLQKMLKRLG